MKFTKGYIDYNDAEIEVPETEVHKYFENALQNKWNTRPSDVAWEMAQEIYEDYNDDEYHDEIVEFGDAWYSDELLSMCEEYVNEHIDEFNNRPIIEGDQVLLFDPNEYNK